MDIFAENNQSATGIIRTYPGLGSRATKSRIASIAERALTTRPRCHGGDVQPSPQSSLAKITREFHWMKCRRPFTIGLPQHVCGPHPDPSTDRVQAIVTGSADSTREEAMHE